MSQRRTFEVIEQLGGIVTKEDLMRLGIKYPSNDLERLAKNGYIERIDSILKGNGGRVKIYYTI
jgi:hypothetical protein